MAESLVLVDACEGAKVAGETLFIAFPGVCAPEWPRTDGVVVNPSTWQDAARRNANERWSFIFTRLLFTPSIRFKLSRVENVAIVTLKWC